MALDWAATRSSRAPAGLEQLDAEQELADRAAGDADVVVPGAVVDAGARSGAVDDVPGEVDRDAGRPDDEARAGAVEEIGGEPDVGGDDGAAGDAASGGGRRRRGVRRRAPAATRAASATSARRAGGGA